MRLLLIVPATVVVTGILLFLYFRDSRMLVSRSPDGQIQITLWDRADPMFGDDLRVTVNRAGHEQFLYKHVNDACGPPRQGHVVWAPDSQSAAFFLCDGLCGPTFVLYDRKTNRAEQGSEAIEKGIVILLNQYDQQAFPFDRNLMHDRPWVWACEQASKRNQ
jgi:hypothetical protein